MISVTVTDAIRSEGGASGDLISAVVGGCLFAGVCVVHALAAPAADVAAPHKLTVTALDMADHMRVVTAAAAQQVAAIRAAGGAVTMAPPGACHTTLMVLHTVVWRFVDEDELLSVNREVEPVFPDLFPGTAPHL